LAIAAGTHLGCKNERPERKEPPSTAIAPTAERTSSSGVAPSPSGVRDDCRDLVEPHASSPPPTSPTLRKEHGTQHAIHVSTRAPWRSLRDHGFAAAYAAAAYGGEANEAFAANWRAMAECRIPRGAYHFVTPDKDGAGQARVFLAQLGADRGELPPVIDLEKPVACQSTCCDRPCAQWIAVTRTWIETVQKALQRKPMVYTLEPFFNECLCGSTAFADHPLWLGAWPKFDFPDPVRFGGWRRWTMYHYLGNQRLAGGVIDIDLVREALLDPVPK
jgi:lysozyme